jgi:hypothetical protein
MGEFAHRRLQDECADGFAWRAQPADGCARRLTVAVVGKATAPASASYPLKNGRRGKLRLRRSRRAARRLVRRKIALGTATEQDRSGRPKIASKELRVKRRSARRRQRAERARHPAGGADLRCSPGRRREGARPGSASRALSYVSDASQRVRARGAELDGARQFFPVFIPASAALDLILGRGTYDS